MSFFTLSLSLAPLKVYQVNAGIPKKGLYYPPTLITGVQTVSRVVVEEVSGSLLLILMLLVVQWW